MLPADWLLANADRFLHDPARIIASAQEWEPEWGFPEINGNYFLVRDNRIVYTGISSYVEQRLIRHAEGGKPFTHVWAFHGLPRLLAEAVETFYIHALSPELNVKRPRLWRELHALYERTPWAATSLSAEALG